MGEQLTLVAELGAVDPGAMPYEVRSVDQADAEALGRLYFESYAPGIAGATLKEATDDIRASFDGEYGQLIGEASLVAVEDGALVGAILTVLRPPWDGLPDCPLIIELFVDRGHRRRGVGRGLIERAMTALVRTDEWRVALRVDTANRAAIRLYESLRFVSWSGA